LFSIINILDLINFPLKYFKIIYISQLLAS